MVKTRPNLISLAVVKSKEDGRHNEFSQIKDTSRAGNEWGYRFFILFSPVSLSLEQPQQLLKEIQVLCTLIEENKTQGLFEYSGI